MRRKPLRLHTRAALIQRIVRLERLCAELYQVVGCAGAPERVLDAVSAAMMGHRIPKAELLPIHPNDFEDLRDPR